MSEPTDIVEKLEQVAACFKYRTFFPAWFSGAISATGSTRAWIALLDGAIDEIRRLRGGGEELEQMRMLAGRLLRRLESGAADVAFIERVREEMEEAEE
jgi:hypothetical protein